MKLFKEEMPGSATESGRIKLFLLLILITSINYPQIPVNGFCRYNKIDVDSGYTSLFQLNYNNDAHSDIVLFNPSSNKIVVMGGAKSGTFLSPVKYTFPVPISTIENITDSKNRIKGYFYTSRKSLEAGTISFNNRGKPAGGKKIKLSSYPEFVDIKDADGNDTSDYLISGTSYKGISLITETNAGLSIRQSVADDIYSRAVFSDISNDGFQDIAAHNIITNSIDLFYNNGAGSFYKVRSLLFENKITCFKMNDIDLDGYEDIVLSYGRYLKIFYGDYKSSFSAELPLSVGYHPSSFLTADYNKDGFIDIAYLDKSDGLISIVFASGSRTFHKEILYMKKKNLEGMIPYYSKFINGIIALSSYGYLYSLTNLSAFSELVNISACVFPSEIKHFDYDNDGIIDFAFTDRYDQKLKIILRNKEGIPSIYFSYPLFENFEAFLVEMVSYQKKRFYCYTRGRKLVEIIDADLKTGNFRRSSLYSPGNIIDVKVEHDQDNNSELFIAFNSSGRLGITKVTKPEMKFTFNTTLGISANVDEAWFGEETSSYLYYWKKQNSSFQLSRISYNRMFDDIKNLGRIEGKHRCSVTGITGNLVNNTREHTLSFLNCADGNLTISASDSLFLYFTEKSYSARVSSRHHLFSGETRFNGLRKLSYFDDSGRVNSIELINNGATLIKSELAFAKGVESFFIKNMSFRNYHLVYTNNLENCITVIQL